MVEVPPVKQDIYNELLNLYQKFGGWLQWADDNFV